MTAGTAGAGQPWHPAPGTWRPNKGTASGIASPAGTGLANGGRRRGVGVVGFVVLAKEPVEDSAGESGEGGLNLGEGEPEGAEDEAGFDADAGEAPGAAAAGAVQG